jgi:hypothetical protein
MVAAVAGRQGKRWSRAQQAPFGWSRIRASTHEPGTSGIEVLQKALTGEPSSRHLFRHAIEDIAFEKTASGTIDSTELSAYAVSRV